MSTLRRGDRGSAVTEIRSTLASLGWLDHPDADLTTGRHAVPEMFDAELDQAVRAFQQHRGLLVDGVVGEARRSGAQQDRHEDADVLLAGHNEPRECADDQTADDCGDDCPQHGCCSFVSGV